MARDGVFHLPFFFVSCSPFPFSLHSPSTLSSSPNVLTTSLGLINSSLVLPATISCPPPPSFFHFFFFLGPNLLSLLFPVISGFFLSS